MKGRAAGTQRMVWGEGADGGRGKGTSGKGWTGGRRIGMEGLRRGAKDWDGLTEDLDGDGWKEVDEGWDGGWNGMEGTMDEGWAV